VTSSIVGLSVVVSWNLLTQLSPRRTLSPSSQSSQLAPKRSISKLPQGIRISQFFAMSNSCVGRIRCHINNQAPRIQRGPLVVIRTVLEMRGTMVTRLAILDILTLRSIDIFINSEYSLRLRSICRFAISVEIRLRFLIISSNTQISVVNWLGKGFQHPPWESTVSLCLTTTSDPAHPSTMLGCERSESSVRRRNRV
jgi:hypothetical protein